MKIRQTIGRRLALVIITLNVVSVVLVSLLFYRQFRAALDERVLLQLTSIKMLKKTQIELFLTEQYQRLKRENATASWQPDQPLPYHQIMLLTGTKPQILLEGMSSPVDLADSNAQQPLYDLTAQHPEGRLTLLFVKKTSSTERIVMAWQGDEIQQILNERTGMGETGESYLVGADTTLRTASRFFPDQLPTTIRASEAPIRHLQIGDPPMGIFSDYRNKTVFSSFSPIHTLGLNWMILSEMDMEEALAPLQQLRQNLFSIFIIVTVVVLLVSILLARNLVKPVVAMKNSLEGLAKGRHVSIPQPPPAQEDEITRMQRALHQLIMALEEVSRFADEIGTGNFEATYHLRSQEDSLGQSLLRMRDQLKSYQQNEAELIRQNQRALLQGQEQERTRLSQELHDGLGPLLTTLKLTIQSVKIEDSQKQKVLEMLDETISEVRSMAHNLMPSVLLDFGVGEAIRNLVNRIQKVSSVRIRYANDMHGNSQLPDEYHIQIYRIVQEALNNAVTHANATDIGLSLTQFDHYIGFYIQDNGQGFDPKQPGKGNGLGNMKARTKLLNGTLEMASDNSGTTIEIELPLPHEFH